MRLRPTVWDMILFTGVVATCLITVPFLVAFERSRDFLRRRKVAVIDSAEGKIPSNRSPHLGRWTRLNGGLFGFPRKEKQPRDETVQEREPQLAIIPELRHVSPPPTVTLWLLKRMRPSRGI